MFRGGKMLAGLMYKRQCDKTWYEGDDMEELEVLERLAGLD